MKFKDLLSGLPLRVLSLQSIFVPFYLVYLGIAAYVVICPERAYAEVGMKDDSQNQQGLVRAAVVTESRSPDESFSEPLGQELQIVVRTIQAQGRIDEHLRSDKPIPIRIDSRLSDLADKLRRLPFRGFVYMSGDERTVPVRRKSVVALVNGQSLALRPLYIDKEKVGLWVRWTDKSGAEILDTRMHLDIGQSMIAGTDLLNDPSGGLVLAVEVTPR